MVKPEVVILHIGLFNWHVALEFSRCRGTTVMAFWTERGAEEFAKRLRDIFDYEERMAKEVAEYDERTKEELRRRSDEKFARTMERMREEQA